MSPRRLVRLASVALLAVGLAACDSLPTEEAVEGDLYEQLAGRRAFATFAEALDAADLGDIVRGDVTVLAPTDVAFDYVGDDFIGLLTNGRNSEVLRRVLRSHVIAGRLGPDDFVDGDTLRSIDGLALPVHRLGPFVRIGSATLDVSGPIEAEGGIAYALGDLLLRALTTRERVELSPSLSRFRATASQTGLLDQADALGRVTVLAPLNDGYAALGRLGDRLVSVTSNEDVLRRTMGFHLVDGVEPLVDGGTLTTADGARLEVAFQGTVPTVGGRRVLREEATSDGRLLVLESVILDPLTLAERLRIEPDALEYWREIRDTQPELWARFQDPNEDLTVFAPTALAYEQRGNDINNALADGVNAALNARVLQTHIVEGRYETAALVDEATLPSVEGRPLEVERLTDTLARVSGLAVDLPVRRTVNGGLYLVDAFLRPAVDALDTALLRGFTEHVTAVRQAGLEAEFRAPGITVFLAPEGPPMLDPGPFLRYNATSSFLPSLGDVSFTAFDGSERSIRFVACTDPADRMCSPYQFASDGIQIYEGSPSEDGASMLHVLRFNSFPPGG